MSRTAGCAPILAVCVMAMHDAAFGDTPDRPGIDARAWYEHVSSLPAYPLGQLHPAEELSSSACALHTWGHSPF